MKALEADDGKLKCENHDHDHDQSNIGSKSRALAGVLPHPRFFVKNKMGVQPCCLRWSIS